MRTLAAQRWALLFQAKVAPPDGARRRHNVTQGARFVTLTTTTTTTTTSIRRTDTVDVGSPSPQAAAATAAPEVLPIAANV